ncbi:MAG TPA: SDR family NAD(P)-dependent oxidoreductase [Acidimicrobiales bacterium]|nr:SDR family NAD(P)-dependent oxidoreductase [Acidimicrobiales bacterium]
MTGATGGLGGRLAETLTAEGMSVIVTGRQADELEALAARTGAQPVVADLSGPDGVAGLVRAAEAIGPVDLLVSNAALPGSGQLVEYDSAGIERTVHVNLLAPVLLARAFLPGMLERGRGHIVIMSSLAGLAAAPASSLYAATKFGLRGFGLSLRQDLHGTGVGVSMVLPGFVREAGMFVKSGARLPPGVGTTTPGRVAAAVVDAVRADKAEVLVAPLPMRVGAHLGGLLPGIAGRVTRLAGQGTAEGIADGQRGRRA